MRIDLTDDSEPVILLNDGETFTGLGGCQLIVLMQEEAERVADDACLTWIKAAGKPALVVVAVRARAYIPNPRLDLVTDLRAVQGALRALVFRVLSQTRYCAFG
jgi:hypothetical protein